MSAGDVSPKMKGSYAAHTAFVLNGQLILAGTAGTAGDIPVSQGLGLPPTWTNISSIPFTGPLLITDGSVTAPGLAFASETDTGIYKPTTGELGIVTGGVEAGYFTSGGLNIPGSLAITGSSTFSSNVTIDAPATGNALTISGIATANALNISTGSIAFNGSAGTSGQVLTSGGPGALPTWITLTGTSNEINVSSSTGAVTVSLSSNIIIPTPTTGVALTVNGVSGTGNNTAVFNSGQSATSAVTDVQVNRAGSTANAVAQGPNIQLNDTTNNTSTMLQQSGGQTELWQYNSIWQQIAYWDASQNFTINPSSVAPFTFTIGVNDTAYSQITFPATINHNAINWARNANSSLAFQVYNNTLSISLFQIEDSGNTFIGPPTSGTAVTIHGTAADHGALQINDGASAAQQTTPVYIVRNGSTANTEQAGPNFILEDSSTSTSSMLQHSGGQTELWQFNGSWHRLVYWDTSFRLNSNEIIASGAVTPSTDNTYTLGGSANRWTVVYATTGTINTSDIRQKTDIQDSNLGLDFVNELRPVSYKWIDGGAGQSGQRTHYGLIAQNVKLAHDKLNPKGDFAGWVLMNKDDTKSTQGLRYDQFIAPLIKAVQELSAKVNELEHELANLKGVQ